MQEPARGGGIVWIAVAAGLLALSAYAALQLGLAGPDTGRLALSSIIISLLLVVQGVKRGLPMPRGWRSRFARWSARWAPPIAAAAATLAVYVLVATDWAVLVGLLSVLLIPLGRKAMSRWS